MFRPKFWNVGWPSECCKSIRIYCFKIRGWRPFQIIGTSQLEDLMNLSQLQLQFWAISLNKQNWYSWSDEILPEWGLKPDFATNLLFLQPTFKFFLHYVFILHNSFYKCISSANLVRCSHHLVAKEIQNSCGRDFGPKNVKPSYKVGRMVSNPVNGLING